MPLTLDDNNATFQIRAFKPGFIQINDTTFTQSVNISPTQLVADWPPQTFTELTAVHLEIIKTLKPAILLLGVGSKLEFPSIEIYGDLLNLGIGVEIMNTSAACRTYTILTAEERNVIAALIIN